MQWHIWTTNAVIDVARSELREQRYVKAHENNVGKVSEEISKDDSWKELMIPDEYSAHRKHFIKTNMNLGDIQQPPRLG